MVKLPFEFDKEDFNKIENHSGILSIREKLALLKAFDDELKDSEKSKRVLKSIEADFTKKSMKRRYRLKLAINFYIPMISSHILVSGLTIIDKELEIYKRTHKLVILVNGEFHVY